MASVCSAAPGYKQCVVATRLMFWTGMWSNAASSEDFSFGGRLETRRPQALIRLGLDTARWPIDLNRSACSAQSKMGGRGYRSTSVLRGRSWDTSPNALQAYFRMRPNLRFSYGILAPLWRSDATDRLPYGDWHRRTRADRGLSQPKPQNDCLPSHFGESAPDL